MTNCSLQISMAPSDIRHMVHTLPHQLRALGGQVDDIQFTLDNNHSRVGRYATDEYAEKHAELRRYLERVCDELPRARIVEVDYSPSAMAEVSNAFVGGASFPIKAYDGSPFHAYLYGLLRARYDYVFHIRRACRRRLPRGHLKDAHTGYKREGTGGIWVCQYLN
jgi:hypothetical protein